MNFEVPINHSEGEGRFNPAFKIGHLDDVQPSFVYYAFSKKIEDSWGGEQNIEIAEAVKNQAIEVSPSLREKFQDIKNSAQGNRETLAWLAFTVKRDMAERRIVRDNIVRHKGLSEAEADLLQEKFSNFYQEIEPLFPAEQIEEFVSADVDRRQASWPQLEAKISEAVTFFKPRSSEVEEIIYLPTNPLEKSQAGGGFRLGSKFYINAEHGNEVNEVHEFLHSIINPMTDKLQLSSAEEERILSLCPNKLKRYRFPLSILTEEIIRTYRTGFIPENRPGFEQFKQALMTADKDQLAAALAKDQKNSDILPVGVAELLQDENLMRHYYEKYNQDKLAERLWNFLADYQRSGEDFEKYLLGNYRDILKPDN